MTDADRTAEGSGSRIVNNTLIFGAGSAAGVLITLFLTPLLIDRLGAEAFGVWILATTLSFSLGYLSFAELGIEQSAVRYIAEARAERRAERVGEVVSSTLGIYLVVAVVVAALLVLLAGPISRLFSIPDELADDAVLAFALIGAQLLFDLPLRAFAALLQGVQRFGVWQLVELGRNVLTAIGLATAAIAGWGIVGLAAVSLGVSAIVSLVGPVVALRTAPGTPVALRLVHRRVVRELVTFGGQLLVFRVAGLVYRQVDRTILGIMGSPTAVTQYEIANRIQQGAGMVESVALSSLVPAAAYNRAERERLQDMLLRGTAYATAATMPFIVAGFVFAEPLIRTWIGDDFASSAGPARLFLAVLVLSLLVSVGQSILAGLGRIGGMAVITVLWVVLNIPLSIALVDPLGVEGVILGTLISQAVTFGPMLFLILRHLDVRLLHFVRRAVMPNLPGVALQAGVAAALLGLADRAESLAIVGLLAAVSCAVSLAGFVLVGLRGADRRALLDVVGDALPRR